MSEITLFFIDITFAFREMVETIGNLIADTQLATPMGFAVVALAGMVMGLAPNMLPLAPVVLGLVAGQHDEETAARRRSRGLRMALAFALGMATVDAAIGVLFGLLGYYVARTLAVYLSLSNFLLGLLLVIIGFALLRLIRFRLPFATPAPREVKTAFGAYMLGVPFGLVVCPACTPLVLPVIAGISATATPWLAGALLFTFGLGRGVPLVIVGSAAGLLKSLAPLQRAMPWIERLGGATLILAGLYFFYQSAVYKGWVGPLGTGF